MREIKYRVFYEGRMYYSDDVNLADYLGVRLGESLLAGFINRFYGLSHLMEYTGLFVPTLGTNIFVPTLGTNIEEIYEGDIIKRNDFYFVVEFIDGCFQAVNPHLSKDRCPLYLHDYTIQGNIYEHADLLEGK